MYVYINMYIPEEGSAEIHTKLFIILIPGVREVQDNFHYVLPPTPKPQECIHKYVIKEN